MYVNGIINGQIPAKLLLDDAINLLNVKYLRSLLSQANLLSVTGADLL